jgi:hypothetical protein
LRGIYPPATGGKEMSKELVSRDYTLDNIINVEAPKDAEWEEVHELLRDKLLKLLMDKDEQFEFLGFYEEEEQ